MRDLKKQLAAVRDPGFTVDVEADVKPAKAKTDRFRTEEERNPVDVDVDADTSGATAHMTIWRTTQERNPVKIRATVDRQAFDRSLKPMNETIDRFNRTNIFKVGVAVIGSEAIGPAALGLANLADALQRVSQAGLVVPGILAGVAASVGTLALGLSGIGDAYKAGAQAAQESGRTQKQAAEEASRSQDRLRNSVVDHAQAQKDLNRAVRDAAKELQDLRIQQRGGVLDESRAILNARQARERLLRGDYTDLRDALLDVQEADQSVLETRARNLDTSQKLTEANEKGIAGSDNVVAANERLIRSQQSLADAMRDVADAQSKTSTAADKFQQQLAALSPAAQELVKTFLRLKPEFQQFRASISQPLLKGKAKEFEDFFHDIIPVITPGMQAIAKTWNEGMTKFLRSVGSDESKGIIGAILGDTAEAQARMTDAIDPLVKAMGILAQAGADSLPRIADALVTMTERFEDFIRTADESGDLQRWIDEGLDAIADLSESILNIGKSFTAITTAAGGGGTFLQWLRTATGDLQTFLNSPEGQHALRDFFADAKAKFDEWKPLIENLITNTIPDMIAGFQQFGDDILPILTQMGDTLSKMPHWVTAVAEGFAAWVTITATVNLITKAINGLTLALGGEAVAGTVGATAAKGGKGAGLLSIVARNPLLAVLGLMAYAYMQPDAGGPPDYAGSQPGLLVPQGTAPPLTPEQQAANLGLFPQTPQGPAGPGPRQLPFEVSPRGPGGAPTNQTPTVRAGDLRIGDRVPPGYTWSTDGVLHDQAGNVVPPDTMLSAAGVQAPPQREVQRPPAAVRRRASDYKSGEPLPPPYYWTPEGIRDGFGRQVERDTWLPAMPTPIPGRAFGGPTPNGSGPGPTGGYLVEVHGGEWVLPAPARAKIGDRRLAGWTRGVTPGFKDGGPVDPNDLLAQMGLSPLSPAPVAPNPYPTGGPDILSRIAGGLSTPISIATNLASAGAGAAQGSAHGTLGGAAPGPASGPAPGGIGSFGSGFLGGALGASGIPGLGGFGGGGGGNTGITPGLWGLAQVFNPGLSPEQQAAGLEAWGAQTGQWLGTFGANTLSSFAGTLLGTQGGGGLLGGLGLSGLASSPYAQAARSAAGHFSSLIPAMGATGGLTAEQLAMIQSDPALMAELFPQAYQGDGTGATATAATAGLTTADLSTKVTGGGGLQVNTARGKQIIQKYFPWATDIGGVRADKLKWHPSGLALDVMIPGAGGLNDPTPAAGKAEGDQLYAWLMAHKQELGIDYIMWQQKDHFNHLHVNFAASGYPTGGAPAAALALPPPPGASTDGSTGGWWPKLAQTTGPTPHLYGGPIGYPSYAYGGPIPQGVVPRPVQPGPPTPARKILPPPTPARKIAPPGPSRAPSLGPPPPSTTVPSVAPPTAPAAAPPPPVTAPTLPSLRAPYTAPIAKAPAEASPTHTLPWIDKAIDSGAQAIGQALSTAIGLAGAGAGAFGGGAAGAIGPYAAGLVMQGGKIVKGVANVVSSALVGSVPGSFGTTDNPYGETMRPPQRDLATGLGRVASYGPFFGHDSKDVMRDIQIHESINQQVAFANYSTKRI